VAGNPDRTVHSEVALSPRLAGQRTFRWHVVRVVLEIAVYALDNSTHPVRLVMV
jgi:hypothetical protein